MIVRRQLLAFASAGLIATAARAEPWLHSYVVIYCDPTLKPVLRQIAKKFPAPVIIFAAPPALSLGLLAHETQDDLLITRIEAAQDAAARKLLADGQPPPAIWRNQLVIAAAKSNATPIANLDAPTILARLGDGQFALTDASPAATIDGPAIIAALGLTQPLANRIIPAAGTDEIAFLIKTGAAKLGLCHRTDVRTDDSLAELASLPAASYPPISYCVSRTRKAWSANMDAFEKFLADPDTARNLARLGLEHT